MRNGKGTLFIVATPIGNLQDITLRALETLKTVDLILAEDTRHTGQLLNHYTIHKPMLSFHEHNENQRANEVLEKLKEGQSLALVSDAGTPLVSDPGYKLVRICIENGIKVESNPGPTAAIAALTVSGLPPDKFLFLGFLPEKQSKRQRLLQSLIPICHCEERVLSLGRESNEAISNGQEDHRLRQDDPHLTSPSSKGRNYASLSSPFQRGRSKEGNEGALKATIIIYESPYHLKKTLEELRLTFDNIPIVICRELTKLHEEVFRGTIEVAIQHFLPADLPDGSQGRQGQNPKGEFVILL